MKARYVRISTPQQKYERQLRKEHMNEELYIDVLSGSIPFHEREQGKALLLAVKQRKINYISVKSIDRLGRNLLDILKTLQIFEDLKINMKIDDLGIESMVSGKTNSAFKLIISVLANIAEMERETMLLRQKEGIAIAKANGVYKGRQRGSSESESQFLKKYPKVISHLKRGQSLRNTAKLCGLSLGTVQKVKRIVRS